MTPWFFAVGCAAFPLGVLAGVYAGDSNSTGFTGTVYIGSILLGGLAIGVALTKVLS